MTLGVDAQLTQKRVKSDSKKGFCDWKPFFWVTLTLFWVNWASTPRVTFESLFWVTLIVFGLLGALGGATYWSQSLSRSRLIFLSVSFIRQEKAHKHKLFGPVALGTLDERQITHLICAHPAPVRPCLDQKKWGPQRKDVSTTGVESFLRPESFAKKRGFSEGGFCRIQCFRATG